MKITDDPRWAVSLLRPLWFVFVFVLTGAANATRLMEELIEYKYKYFFILSFFIHSFIVKLLNTFNTFKIALLAGKFFRKDQVGHGSKFMLT